MTEAESSEAVITITVTSGVNSLLKSKDSSVARTFLFKELLHIKNTQPWVA